MNLPAPLTDPYFCAEFFNRADGIGSFHTLNEDGTPIRFEQSQGVWLVCPHNYGKKDNVGESHFLVAFANPPCGILVPPAFGPISRSGTYPRWQVSGLGLHDLTTTPSISIGEPEIWHGYITNGMVHL